MTHQVLRTMVVLAILGPSIANAQSLTYAEVAATGAKPLTAAEAKELVAGAKAEFTLVNGSVRTWVNGADGTFVASRNVGDIQRRSARGTWSINDDAAYCVSFDWSAMEVDSFCRQLYRVEDRYYAFKLDPTPETRSGRFRFSR